MLCLYLLPMKSHYLIVFAQSHSDFRLPELQSVSELHGFQVSLPEDSDTSRPFMVVELEKEGHALILAHRCVLIKWIFFFMSFVASFSLWKRSIYEFYARGETYDQVHNMNRSNKHLWEKYIPDTSFKFNVTGFNHTIPQRRQRDVIESFSYMDLQGKIDLKNPEITMACFEECKFTCPKYSVVRELKNWKSRIDESRITVPNGSPRKRCENDSHFKEVFFGRLVRPFSRHDRR